MQAEELTTEKGGGRYVLNNELSLLVRSRYGIIYLQTSEQGRAESLLHHLADNLNLPFFTWTPAKGLQRDDIGESEDSGAEIEQVIVSALYSAFSDNASLEPRYLIEEIARTKPLSKTRAEDITFLRQWAQERTVPAQ